MRIACEISRTSCSVRSSKGDVFKPPLHLRPFGSPARRHVVGVAVERLMQDGQHQERPLRPRGGFRDLLQGEDIPSLGMAGAVFEEFSELVNDEENPGHVLVQTAQVIVGLLEEGGDRIARWVRSSLRSARACR